MIESYTFRAIGASPNLAAEKSLQKPLDKSVQMYHIEGMGNTGQFTTGDVAAITGVGFEALRQYLKRGQLTFIEESEGGWLRFSEDDLFRVALFAELRKVGISTGNAAAAVAANRLRLRGEEPFFVVLFDFRRRGKVLATTAGVGDLSVLLGNAPGAIRAAHVVVLHKLRAELLERIADYWREARR